MGPEQAPGIADEPAAIAPDPQPPAAAAPPTVAAPPPPTARRGRRRPTGRPAGLLHRPPRHRRRRSGPAARARGALDRPGPPGAAARNAGVRRVQFAERTVAAQSGAPRVRQARHASPGPRGGAPRDVRGRARDGGGAASVRRQDIVSGPPADGHAASGGHAPGLDRRAPALTCPALAPDRTNVAGHTNRDRPHRAHGGGQRANPEPAERIGPPPGCRRAPRQRRGRTSHPGRPARRGVKQPPRQRRHASRRRTGRAWRPTRRGP